MATAHKFFELFQGLDRAHTEWTPGPAVAGKQKREGRYITKRDPVTPALWQAHIDGKVGLTIIPIRDDATVLFGAIDIDVYDLDLHTLETKVEACGLPLIVCRTKSGGAHLYCFFKEPVAAKLVKERLSEWALHLGHSGSEIFPKQTQLGGPNDVGNGINAPYFNAETPSRYAIKDGAALDAERFLAYAAEKALTGEQFAAITLPELAAIEDGPPCLQAIMAEGVPRGGRNSTLFNLAVYCRLRYGAEMAAKLKELHDAYFKEPISAEIPLVVRSMQQKPDYYYTCGQPPICHHCNKTLCRARKYGIGNADGDDPGVTFGGLTQINSVPPVYVLDVNDARIELTSAELVSYRSIQLKAIEKLRIFPKPFKKWQDFLRETLLPNTAIIEVPESVGAEGEFWCRVRDYCTETAEARSWSELSLKKPFTEEGVTYFVFDGLQEYLRRTGFTAIKKSEKMWSILLDNGATETKKLIRGHNRTICAIPAFPKYSEAYAVPNPAEEREF